MVKHNYCITETNPDSGISFLSTISFRVFTRQTTMTLTFTIISESKTSLANSKNIRKSISAYTCISTIYKILFTYRIQVHVCVPKYMYM